MPTKSTGCLTCRKRKIRCDETRPGCRKCATHGVLCPGYRPRQNGILEIEDETALVIRKARNGHLRSSSKGHAGKINGTEVVVREISHSNSSSPPSPEASPYGHLNSVAMERVNLYSTFLGIYLPMHSIEGKRRDQSFGFLKRLVNLPNPPPALTHGLDALSMVQIGSVHNDSDLLARSVSSYSRSLSNLALAIANPGSIYDDMSLAAITVLQNCEFFEHIGKMGTAGWAKHLKGGLQLLLARGPDSLQSEMATMLYSNMRHAALSYSLIARQECILGRQEWRAVAFRQPVVQDAVAMMDQSTLLYDTALQIPGLLQNVDAVSVQSNGAQQQIDDLLAQAAKLESELRAWYHQFEWGVKSMGQEPYILVPIEEMTTFASLVHDRTIDKAFIFPGFGTAYILSVYWYCLHFLLTAVEKLQILRHAVDRDWFPSSDEAGTEEELHNLTLNLCRCLPYFTEPVSSSTGQIGMFLPLRTAALYFIEKGNWKLAKWLGEVKSNAFTKGMSPPGTAGQNQQLAIRAAVR